MTIVKEQQKHIHSGLKVDQINSGNRRDFLSTHNYTRDWTGYQCERWCDQQKSKSHSTSVRTHSSQHNVHPYIVTIA